MLTQLAHEQFMNTTRQLQTFLSAQHSTELRQAQQSRLDVVQQAQRATEHLRQIQHAAMEAHQSRLDVVQQAQRAAEHLHQIQHAAMEAQHAASRFFTPPSFPQINNWTPGVNWDQVAVQTAQHAEQCRQAAERAREAAERAREAQRAASGFFTPPSFPQINTWESGPLK
jgi:hypothetical protein